MFHIARILEVAFVLLLDCCFPERMVLDKEESEYRGLRYISLIRHECVIPFSNRTTENGLRAGKDCVQLSARKKLKYKLQKTDVPSNFHAKQSL